MRSLLSATAIAALLVGGGVLAAPADAAELKAVFTGTFGYIGYSLQEGDQKIPFITTILYDPSLGGDMMAASGQTISGGT